MKDLQRLGKLLRKHRTAMGYSLRKAAYTAGISPPALSQAELGRDTCQLSGDTLCRLSNLYGVDEFKYLQLAHKLPSHVLEVLMRHPFEACNLADELLRNEEPSA